MKTLRILGRINNSRDIGSYLTDDILAGVCRMIDKAKKFNTSELRLCVGVRDGAEFRLSEPHTEELRRVVAKLQECRPQEDRDLGDMYLYVTHGMP